MRVLITGGMGVIGAEASRKFVSEGHRPVLFARHRDEILIGDIVDKVDIELGDILDLPRLLEVIKTHGVTHIVHTAAFVGAVSAKHPALSIQVNVIGTVNVLEAARALDVKRVVFTSAKGVYGPVIGDYGAPTYKPISEDLPSEAEAHLRFRQAHGRERHASITTATWASRRWSLRFATTYGPGKTARHGTMGVTSRSSRPGARPAVQPRSRAAMTRTTSSTTRIPRSASISPPSPRR